MDWLDLLRWINLIAIGLSVGFLTAVAWQTHRLLQIPMWVHGLGVSYALFAIGSMVEIELSFHHGASWRTAVVTAGAIVGIATSVLAFFAVRRIRLAKRVNAVH